MDTYNKNEERFEDIPLEGIGMSAIQCPSTEHQLQWLTNNLEVNSSFSDVYYPGLYLKTREMSKKLPRIDTDL